MQRFVAVGDTGKSRYKGTKIASVRAARIADKSRVFSRTLVPRFLAFAVTTGRHRGLAGVDLRLLVPTEACLDVVIGTDCFATLLAISPRSFSRWTMTVLTSNPSTRQDVP